MPTQVFVSAKLRDEPDQLERVHEVLRSGERVLAVLSVTKTHPALRLLVITSHRVLAGWPGELDAPGQGWEIELPVEDVASVEVTGFMDNVCLHLRAGDDVKVGNLSDGADEPELLAALARAHLGPADPEPPAGPTYEVWRP